MANVQDLKAQKAVKTLRLFTILLLVVGIVTLAVTFYDALSGEKLLKLFDAKAAAEPVATGDAADDTANVAADTAETATETAAAAAETTETAAAAAETTAAVPEDTNKGGLGVARVLLIIASVLLVIGTIMQLVKGNYRTFQGTCLAAIIFCLFPLIVFAVNIGSHLFALIYTLLILAIIVLAIFAMKSRWQVYIKEMTGEVKKLTWLNMKELVKATAVVLVFVLAFALLIFVLDFLFGLPIKALLTTGDQSATTDTTQDGQDQSNENDQTTTDGTTEEGTTEEGTTEEGATEEGTTEEGTTEEGTTEEGTTEEGTTEEGTTEEGTTEEGTTEEAGEGSENNG